MGFGLLFIGYIFLFRIATGSSGFDYLPDIVGYVIMFAALSKLSVYNRGFRYAKGFLIPLTILGAAVFGFGLCDLVGIELPSAASTVETWVSSFLQAFMFAYHGALLFGIRDIANETELPKVAWRAVRNFVITVIYYAMVLISGMLPFEGISAGYVSMLIYLFGIIWMILNMVLIFSCYMWICLEGDEDMPVKPSRFGFINKINAKIDSALAKTEKSGREYGEYKHEKKKKKKRK